MSITMRELLESLEEDKVLKKEKLDADVFRAFAALYLGEREMGCIGYTRDSEDLEGIKPSKSDSYLYKQVKKKYPNLRKFNSYLNSSEYYMLEPAEGKRKLWKAVKTTKSVNAYTESYEYYGLMVSFKVEIREGKEVVKDYDLLKMEHDFDWNTYSSSKWNNIDTIEFFKELKVIQEEKRKKSRENKHYNYLLGKIEEVIKE